MSRVMNIAKLTFAFVVIAGGFSIIVGSLMGGGSSRVYDKVRGINTDPRSILVQSVLIETTPGGVLPAEIPEPGECLSDAEFRKLVSEADELRSDNGVRVRTPAMLIQHGESGAITVNYGDRIFEADVSPSVIDTKHGPVLRVALQIVQSETDSSQTPHAMNFATAFTTAPGNAVVLDLAGIGEPGSRSVLALRTTLSDPTPTPPN